MLGLIAAMRPHATVPLVAKPNAGLPTLVGEETVFDMDAARFAGFAEPLAAAGVNLMGGCCGTTPAHIRALRDSLTAVKPVVPDRHAAPAASSARNAVTLRGGGPLVVIGGRLDAAGNETLREGLLAGDFGPVRQAVRAQEKEGAQMLLLKAGAAGLDETRVTRKILEQIAPTTRSTFLLVADRVETLAQALRFYPGRLLVGVDGSDAASVLPVIAQYGAVPVLPIPAQGGRVAILKAAADARKYGFTREGMIIDCTPVQINPATLREAVGMIAWCEKSLRCRTLMNFTHIGQVLPEQPWLQAGVLAVAQTAGLTIAVIDPAVVEPMKIRAVGDWLRSGS